MFRSVRMLALTAIVALLSSADARAAFTIRLTSGTGPGNTAEFTSATLADNNFSIMQTFRNFNINLFIDNQPFGFAGTTNALVTNSVTTVLMNTAPVGTESNMLTVDFFGYQFTGPGGPGSPMVSTGALTYQSNAQAPSTGTTAYQSFAGSATGVFPAMTFTNLGSSNTVSLSGPAQGTALTSAYSWTRGANFFLGGELNYTFTGGAGTFMSTQASTSAAVAPAPAALILALTGVPVVGLGAWLRRRRNS
jgi:hypothetical protein